VVLDRAENASRVLDRGIVGHVVERDPRPLQGRKEERSSPLHFVTRWTVDERHTYALKAVDAGQYRI
jgi:hypothetical protein